MHHTKDNIINLNDIEEEDLHLDSDSSNDSFKTDEKDAGPPVNLNPKEIQKRLSMNIKQTKLKQKVIRMMKEFKNRRKIKAAMVIQRAWRRHLETQE